MARLARVMMPLSFVTILGGMTTLIGSSTNLLAANVARQAGAVDLAFFSFTPIALVLAAVGLPYVIGVIPFMLRSRGTMADALRGSQGKQFIAEIPIRAGHPLVGASANAGMFPQLKDMTVRLVQRGERPHLPPFENLTLQPGDIVIVAATRAALERALAGQASVIRGGGDDEEQPRQLGVVTLAEAIVAPGSRLIGRTVSQSGFRGETGCVVLAIERRSRMPRMPMADIRMEAGDVLLFAGPRKGIEELRGNRDILLIDWTAADVPARQRAPLALLIFGAVIFMAATFGENGRPPESITQARIYPLVNATARALQTLAPESSRIGSSAPLPGSTNDPIAETIRNNDTSYGRRDRNRLDDLIGSTTDDQEDDG